MPPFFCPKTLAVVFRRGNLRGVPWAHQDLDPALLPNGIPQALVPAGGTAADRGQRGLYCRLRLPPAVPVPAGGGRLERLGPRRRQ